MDKNFLNTINGIQKTAIIIAAGSILINTVSKNAMEKTGGDSYVITIFSKNTIGRIGLAAALLALSISIIKIATDIKITAS